MHPIFKMTSFFNNFSSPKNFYVLILSFLILSACGGGGRNPNTLTKPRNYLIGIDRGNHGGDDELQGGVNAYLWRAAIDTLSFMPLSSADAQGGVILTDWYAPPGTENERFKIAAYITDRQLRADALRLVVFEQNKIKNNWEDVPVAPTTSSDISARILERARQLRTMNLEVKK